MKRDSRLATLVHRLVVVQPEELPALLAAFATLNNAGMGRFADFRNVHSSAGDPEAHQNAGFPPWHRAFLLDLEREAFLSLCGERKTQERIAFTLKTGKALRN